MTKMIMYPAAFLFLTFSLVFVSAQDAPPHLDRPGEQAPQSRSINPAMALSPVTILNLLCEDPELRGETKITDEQIEALKKLMSDLGSRQQAIRTSKEPADKMREKLNELRKQLIPGIAGILTQEQMNRFVTAQYAILGGMDSPLMTAGMLDFLDLNQEQTDKIEALFKERTAAITAMVNEVQAKNPGVRPDAETTMQLRARGIEIAKNCGEKVREILTPEQRKVEEDAQKDAKELRGKLQQFLMRRMGSAPQTPIVE